MPRLARTSSQEPEILLIGESGDAQIAAIEEALRRRGVRPARFTDADALEYGFAWWLEKGRSEVCLNTAKGVIRVEALRSIYWRRPGQVATASGLAEQDTRFVRTELDHVLQSVWAVTHCYWMNYPGHIGRAKFRPYQFSVAAQLGVRVLPIRVAGGARDARHVQAGSDMPWHRRLLAADSFSSEEGGETDDRIPYLVEAAVAEAPRLEIVCIADCCYAFVDRQYLGADAIDASLASFCRRFMRREKLELCGFSFGRHSGRWTLLGAEPDFDWANWDELTPCNDISATIAAALIRGIRADQHA